MRWLTECFDEETQAYLTDGGDPFGFKRLTYIRDVQSPTQPVTGGLTPANDRDAWQVAVGVNFYSRGPLSGGVQYKMSPQLKVDVGATYIFISTPRINQNAGSTNASALLKGSYDSNVIIVSGQVTYSF